MHRDRDRDRETETETERQRDRDRDREIYTQFVIRDVATEVNWNGSIVEKKESFQFRFKRWKS